MYKAKLTVPDIRKTFLDIPPRAQRQFRRELQTVVKPTLQIKVDRVIAPPPGQAVHPFEFVGDEFSGGKLVKSGKSRRWYFANKVPRGSKAGRYSRTKKIEQSWVVIISSQIRVDLITIKNLRPESAYVYGPRQTPGHRRTGWGRDLDRKLREIERQARRLASEAWLRSVQVAMRTRR